jgi:NADPH:quinone reductase-like Zn-dependent oxidoreductase
LPVDYPCVLRGEGVGRAEDGRRVYFGERSVLPFGAWAERTIVPEAEVWDVPDDVDDRTAITLGIAGTGAFVPLRFAAIKPGEQVLILGATGVVGTLGLQLARRLGAGRVVAAGRNRNALDRLEGRGITDAVVQLGQGEDAAALKEAAGEGYDVVLDLVCGAPMLAAMKATRWGARIVTAGNGAGTDLNFSIKDLLFRSLSLIGTGQRPPDDRQAIWRELLQLDREQKFVVDHIDYEFESVSEAWAAQAAAPHGKITAAIR